MRVMLAGQVMVGSCVSFTLMVKVQDLTLGVGMALSAACQVTLVVTPAGNCEPLAVLAGLVRVTITVPQLSEAVGAV